MPQITITWKPGAVRGRTVAQTDRLIVEACQMWQKVCGVQFLAGQFGWPSTITIYPYAGQMAGAMVAYTSTRQILYSTMFWKGPSLFYHAAMEAKKARGQFGQPKAKVKPYSITWLQGEIARLKKIKPLPTKDISAREAQLKRVQAEWKSIGDPMFVSDQVADPICECFGKSGRTQVASNDWPSIFAELRAKEYAA